MPRFTVTNPENADDDEDGIRAGQFSQNNAKFDHQAGKEEYQPLGARISSELHHDPAKILLLNVVIRAVLHQRIRYGDPSVTKHRVYQ